MTISETIQKDALAVRIDLLGEEHWTNTQKNLTAFDAEWQVYVTNKVFGRTWGRGIISQQQFSLINLAMLAGLGRMEEFELHFRIALNRTKVPLEQLRELLLHIVMYCGAPAGRDIFAIARRVLNEEGVDVSILDKSGDDEPSGDHRKDTTGPASLNQG